MDRSTPKLKTRKRRVLKINFTNLSTLILFTYDKEGEVIKQEKAGVKKKKKTTWIFLLVNLVIVAAIFIYQFGFGETRPLSELFAGKPFYRFFFISLGCVGLMYIAGAISYSILFKQTTGRFNFWLGLEFAIVGKYWDNITPFGSGGQFAQVAHGRKKNVDGDVATSVVVGKYMLSMIAFCALGLTAIFIPIDSFSSGELGTFIKIMAIVGVVINLATTLFIWIVSTNRKLCSVIVIGGLKLLHKMHIVKNYNRALYKTMRFIRQYQNAFKYFVKKPWVIISEVLLSFVDMIAMAMISYLVYLAFTFPNNTVGVLPILAISFLCSFATSFVPIPGGSGMAEISFAGLFGGLFAAYPGVSFWALIMWRIFNYYLIIGVGFIFTLVDPLIAKRFQAKKMSFSHKKIHKK